MRSLTASAAIIALLGLTPSAAAETPVSFVGSWNCASLAGEMSGSHTQVFRPDGTASREGTMLIPVDATHTFKVDYVIDAQVSFDGETMSETGYSVPKADVTLNGTPRPDLKADVIATIMQDATHYSILFEDQSTLLLRADDELTACQRTE